MLILMDIRWCVDIVVVVAVLKGKKENACALASVCMRRADYKRIFYLLFEENVCCACRFEYQNKCIEKININDN